MQEFIDKLTILINEAGKTLPPDVIYYSIKNIYLETENAYRVFQQQQKMLKEQQNNQTIKNKQEEK